MAQPKRVETRCDNTPVRPTWTFPEIEVPEAASVVIVGGGIAGASIAFHFAAAGWTDICLLEQNRIGSGTTWHSAGQVGQLRGSSAQTKINQASAQLYSQLETITGHDPGWLQCGGLQLATCRDRMDQLQRQAAMAGVFGVEAEWVSPQRCQSFWPILNIDDILGGVYLPGDGRVLPGECTVALARGAANRGVAMVENATVTGLAFDERRAGMKRFRGVKTDRGEIDCEWVVLAGNMWMRQLGLTAGVDIPVYPCEHHYVITRPVQGVSRDCPCTRDPDAGLYFRALDDGGLKLGAFKKRSKPWKIGDCVPSQFAFDLLKPDWEDFAEPLASHRHRLRGLDKGDDIVQFVNGPEAFTPDNQFIMGQPAMTEGLFVCGGWNSAGIACAGGAGKYAVEWIEAGGMTIDLTSVDIRRFQPFQNDRQYLQSRVSEVLGLHYQMAWPGRQMETARGIRQSRLYAIHQKNNACFGETAGWERPLFFAPPGEEAKEVYSFRKPNWLPWVTAEVDACRKNLGLLDQSTFAKFLVEGPGAAERLQRLCGANVEVPVGNAVYTGMFNQKGTFESDLTVARIDDDRFYLVTATGQQQKDFDWISRHVAADHRVTLTDVTEKYNVLSVMGPSAPKLLNQFLPDSFPMESTKYGTVKQIGRGSDPILAMRISYVGEAGWELHVPVGDAEALYQELTLVGGPLGMMPIGNYAISSMRIEKGFRAYGHELSPEETPLEAGLTWAIDWNKDFLGKAVLQQQRSLRRKKRLAFFSIPDPDVVLWGSEPIIWDGQQVGYTTSACFSPTIGSSVAMGYVRNPHGGPLQTSELRQSKIEIEQLGNRYRATAAFRPVV